MAVDGRDNNGRWLPGTAPNPKGRPRGTGFEAFTSMCRSYMPKSFHILKSIVENPEAREMARMKGIQMLWEYGFGKPKQVVSIERAPDSTPLNELSSVQLLNQILQLEGSDSTSTVIEMKKPGEEEKEVVIVETKVKKRKPKGDESEKGKSKDKES